MSTVHEELQQFRCASRTSFAKYLLI